MGKRKKKSGYWVYQCLTNNTNEWNAVLSLFKILSLSISRFETRTRILFSKSQISRREQDFVINISGFETRPRYFLLSLIFRDGTSRREKPNSHETFRDREYSLCSGFHPYQTDQVYSFSMVQRMVARWRCLNILKRSKRHLFSFEMPINFTVYVSIWHIDIVTGERNVL